MARYLDHYPGCVGCPVAKYCDTMVGSISLCNSYNPENQNNIKIRFSTWENDDITIPVEDIDAIDSHDALTTVVYLKDGKSYRPFGKIKFIE